MSYFTIKIFAIIFMLIDHIGYILLDNNIAFRLIGRLAFPLFAFILVNGYHHTSNKWKYLLKLFVFAIISEIFFDISFFGNLELSHQNIYFTLTIGLFTIIVVDNLTKYLKNLYVNNLSLKFLIIIANFWVVGFLASINHTINGDYKFFGVLLIYLIYIGYGYEIKNKIFISLGIIIANMINYFFIDNNIYQLLSIISILFILLFKEKKVHINKYLKLFFYIFYPLHIFILFLIKGFL